MMEDSGKIFDTMANVSIFVVIGGNFFNWLEIEKNYKWMNGLTDEVYKNSLFVLIDLEIFFLLQ